MNTGDIGGLVEAAVASGDAPGVVAAVARGDDEASVWTAGEATVGGPAMARDTLFRITSMTKPVTAAVTLALVESGLLDLDEPVDEWLPELADRRALRTPGSPLTDTVPAARPIVVRDLLTFTWGFGMQGAMFMADPPWPVAVAADERGLCALGPPKPCTTLSVDTWMERLGELPLMAQPGERWLYNTGSLVLGVLCARAAGAPYDEVVEELVLGPSGMRDTSFATSDTGRLATSYTRTDGGLEVVDAPDGQWTERHEFVDGAAGLVSTADDLVTFGRMLLRRGGRVLSAESVAAMTADQLTDAQRAVWPGFDLLSGRGWGFGGSVLEDGSYTWDGGFGTTWLVDPARDLVVVVLTQRAADSTGMPAVCDAVVAAAKTD